MSIPITFSIEQILAITRQLPDDVKLVLIKEWIKELSNQEQLKKVPSINLEGFDDPIDLDKAAFNKKELNGLKELWKDELPANELVKLL